MGPDQVKERAQGAWDVVQEGVLGHQAVVVCCTSGVLARRYCVRNEGVVMTARRRLIERQGTGG